MEFSGFRGPPDAAPAIERLLTLAQRSPSWCNTQPWQVIVTSGAEADRFREAIMTSALSHEPGFDAGTPTAYTKGDRVIAARRNAR
jgi:nitroreductase